MKLTRIYNWCRENTCPTVYKTDKGTFVIQGYVVKDVKKDVPAGETLIEVPREFLEGFIKEYNKNAE